VNLVVLWQFVLGMFLSDALVLLVLEPLASLSRNYTVHTPCTKSISVQAYLPTMLSPLHAAAVDRAVFKPISLSDSPPPAVPSTNHAAELLLEDLHSTSTHGLEIALTRREWCRLDKKELGSSFQAWRSMRAQF
jgi:hypothetical protein